MAETIHLDKFETPITTRSCPTCGEPTDRLTTLLDADEPDWVTRETTCVACGARIRYHFSLTECDVETPTEKGACT